MSGGVRHPRTILAFRMLLYLGLAVVLGTLAVGVAGYLLLVVAVGGIALLVEAGPGALPLVGVAASGVVVAALAGVGTTIAVRWADRQVVAADRRPDPIEDLTERYVAAEIDEIEFERRVESVLAREAAVDDGESTSWAGRTRDRARTRSRDRNDR